MSERGADRNASLTPAEVVRLQQSAGNQAVLRLLRAVAVKPPYETEGPSENESLTGLKPDATEQP